MVLETSRIASSCICYLRGVGFPSDSQYRKSLGRALISPAWAQCSPVNSLLWLGGGSDYTDTGRGKSSTERGAIFRGMGAVEAEKQLMSVTWCCLDSLTLKLVGLINSWYSRPRVIFTIFLPTQCSFTFSITTTPVSSGEVLYSYSQTTCWYDTPAQWGVGHMTQSGQLAQTMPCGHPYGSYECLEGWSCVSLSSGSPTAVLPRPGWPRKHLGAPPQTYRICKCGAGHWQLSIIYLSVYLSICHLSVYYLPIYLSIYHHLSINHLFFQAFIFLISSLVNRDDWIWVLHHVCTQ